MKATQTDRINWKQACEILKCSKSTFYRLVKSGKLASFGVGASFRTVSRVDCENLAKNPSVPIDKN